MLTKSDLDHIRKVVKEEVKIIDKKLDTVQEDISGILTALDQNQTQLRGRVETLEEELGISKN